MIRFNETVCLTASSRFTLGCPCSSSLVCMPDFARASGCEFLRARRGDDLPRGRQSEQTLGSEHELAQIEQTDAQSTAVQPQCAPSRPNHVPEGPRPWQIVRAVPQWRPSGRCRRPRKDNAGVGLTGSARVFSRTHVGPPLYLRTGLRRATGGSGSRSPRALGDVWIAQMESVMVPHA